VWEGQAPERVEFIQNVLAGEKGDLDARAAVDRALKENPDLASYFDVALQSTVDFKRLCSAGRWFGEMAIGHRMEAMQAELLGDYPTILERMLVEQICRAWLTKMYIDQRYLQLVEAGLDLATAHSFERIVNSVQRRLLEVIKALAQVRRLQLPTVGQVNIGANQLNVATPGQEHLRDRELHSPGDRYQERIRRPKRNPGPTRRR